jgi:endonuclease/exonuclease/phosphatase family metal-dependent hydrolase
MRYGLPFHTPRFHLVMTRSRHSITLLVLFLVGCSTTPRATAPRELRVLVYNVHAGKDADGKDNLDRVAALVREIDADIVLLQELDRATRRSGGVDQPAELARRSGRHAAFGRTLDFQGGQYGIGVLSRWPFDSDTVFHLPVEPPQERSGGSYEPRGAHRVVIRTPWGPIAVVNTHLDASSADNWRRQEARTVIAITRSLRASMPTLVGGDFNSEPGSVVQDTLRAAGLRDAWPLCGVGDSLTYPAGRGVKRIDYLYLAERMSCSEARVLRNDASDHSPLFVRVRVW